ncbi:hypothetical protein DNHGIG_00540 [Collibacillus ludicampi]|uniref:Uncharacterized protein n=1 Tax=Collibacillus ludicampi TaxID=2771369 RepID=A0AAV4L9Q7_9BACL|nr:hypothetical protein [Collibacillus ludicampi]GIM44505.1 hypothetical protein DNHGIG_00540 [Collibacillus ludicampi]
MLEQIKEYWKKGWKWFTGIGSSTLFGIMWARAQNSLATISDNIQSWISLPFVWWVKLGGLVKNQPLFQWLYILATFLFLHIICYGIYYVYLKYLKRTGKKKLVTLLCEQEIEKIIKKLERNQDEDIQDDVFEILKKFEKGFSEIFSIENKRDFLCVWVRPKKADEEGVDGYTWVGISLGYSVPENVLEIINTGVTKRGKNTHYLTDLKSYDTEAKEFAFIRNIGEFKFGVGILFMKEGFVKPDKQKEFEISTSLLHLLANLDKVPNALV